MNDVKNVKKISKDDVIRAVADASCLNLKNVRAVFSALENVIPTFLQEADKENDVSIKLFEGVYFEGIYCHKCQKKNNLTGKMVDMPSKIKVKPRVTKSYSDRVNEQ